MIAALDACKAAGILKEVEDEGAFWETRDLKTLARNINASTDMIQRVCGSLEQAIENRVESPVKTSRGCARVSAEGGDQ